MDPLSAIGLASNLIAFLDFASKLVIGAREVYTSTSGNTHETAELTHVIEDVQIMTRRLGYPDRPAQQADERAVLELATKCQELSGELVSVLKKLQAKGRNSKLQSFGFAFKTMREKGHLESIEKRLDRYKTQILFRVTIMIGDDTSSVYKLLKNMCQENEISSNRTRKDLKDMQEKVLSTIKATQDTAQNNHKEMREGTLIEIQDILSRIIQAKNSIDKEDWVLGKLSFTEMHRRELSIEKAHKNTFRWLIYDEANDQETPSDKDDLNQKHDNASNDKSNLGLGPEQSDPNPNKYFEEATDAVEEQERQDMRRTFLTWLNSGSGIFHISGKVGSGKSTLMKLLSDDIKVREELNAWAGDSKLIFARFFFWNAGEDLQRSIEGLYRGILWEILREQPNVLKEIFPLYWENDWTPEKSRLGASQLSLSELQDAFGLLLRSRDVFEKHKICLFIDGLDEFQGNHWDLAKQLKNWATSPHLKACVSSRPYNEFIRTFTNPDQHFQLHDLTKRDIRECIQHELQGDERFLAITRDDDRYSRVIKSLQLKANGIFLWVRCALKGFLNGLGNEYTISQLEEEINRLPSDLEALFRKIIDSIPKSDRIRASRHFALLMSDYSFRGISFLLAVHSMLDEFYESEYDMSKLYSSELEPSLSTEDMEKMFQTMQLRLNNRCKGLLQLSQEGKAPDFWSRIDPIHRSMLEFLTLEDVSNELSILSGTFDTAKFISMACLRLLKMCHGLQDTNGAIAHALEPPQNSPPHSSWEEECPRGSYFWLLERFALPIIVIAACEETDDCSPLANELEAAHAIMRTLASCLPPTQPPQNCLLARQRFLALLKSPSHSIESQEKTWIAICALYSAKSVLTKVQNSKREPFGFGSCGLLLHVSLAYVQMYPHRKHPAIPGKLMQSLIDSGQSPNTELPAVDLIKPSNENEPFLYPQICTVWKSLLLIFCRRIATRGRQLNPKLMDDLCKLMAQYLLQGADPDIVFVGYEVADKEVRERNNEPTGENITSHVSGPYFMDLEQLVQVLDPPNRMDLEDILKQRTGSRLWRTSKMLPSLIWHMPKARRVSQMQTSHLDSSFFFTIAVVSRSDLYQMDYSLTEEETDWLARREFKSVPDLNLFI